MAPTRSKKRKSAESNSSVDIQAFPAPPKMVATKTRSPVRTPTRSPIKKTRIGITVGQKQALIDNLQLEITERARRLRAQYMVQAQGLKSRIEIRINRIPMAMRKANMGELFAKHNEQLAPAGPARAEKLKSPTKNLMRKGHSQLRASPSPQRAAKRLSDEIENKENEDIENPKKRHHALPPSPPPRTTSRPNLQQHHSQVLSPRSANSRTIQRSPIRPNPASPAKSLLARPVSPLKPAAPVPSGGAAGILTNMVEKAKSSRAGAARKVTAETAATGVGRGKRVAAAPAEKSKVGRGRAISDSSDGSTTTVVRKPVAAPAKKAPTTKKTVMSTIKSMGSQKKIAAASKPAAGTTGGRVLRKRN